MFRAEVVPAGRIGRVALERLRQHVHVEDVDAHRRQGQVRLAGHRRRRPRLLVESHHPGGVVDGDDAEAMTVFERHLDGRQGDGGAGLLVRAQHAPVVHLVDVVAGQHHDVARRLALDRIHVLVDGVGGAEIPVFADALLRRQDLDELAELLRHDAPTHPDVAVERERLVLGGDEDAPQPRIDGIREHEVDDAVGAAEVDGGLGALARQRREALPRAAREHDDQRIVVNHDGLLDAHAGDSPIPAALKRVGTRVSCLRESTTLSQPSQGQRNSCVSSGLGALTGWDRAHIIAVYIHVLSFPWRYS